MELLGQGAQLLDARDPAEFEAAHIRGALNVGLGGSYATWCGTILDEQQPVVLVAEPGRELEAATRLGRIGFDGIAGYLAGAMESLEERPDLLDRTPWITASALADQLASDAPPLVIDVRTEPECGKAGRIDSATNMPLSRLAEQIASLPSPRSLVVYCASGYRSAIAASVLRRARPADVSDLVGGSAAWEAAALPIERAD